MFIPTALFFGALGYLFYTSKKELVLDDDAIIDDRRNNDELYKDIEDLFI